MAEPPTDVPSPDYPLPPADALPPDYASPGGDSGPGPRKGRRTLAAIAIVLVVVAVIGYAIAGFTFATSRLASARKTYNAVVAHQNAITETVNSFNITFATTSTTVNDLKADRSLLDQVVSMSQAAAVASAADDAALSAAQNSLKDNSWLTILNRSDLDHYSAKLGHDRRALADSRTIAADYVLMATFYRAFFDAIIEYDAMSTKIQASDFPGALALASALKTDLAKALQASDAPGLPPEVGQFIVDFQTFAADEGSLLTAVNSSDVSAALSLSPKVAADVTKLDSYDFTKIGNDIASFYQPLIDDYNSEISKANAM